MIIDTHAHVNFNAYKDDSEEVIRRSLAENIWMINVGSQYTTSKRAVEIAGKYKEGVYAAVGLHPIHVGEEFEYQKYKELANSAVAVGEIGLDYKAEYLPFKEKQKEVLLRQVELAREVNLPVIFHCRLAHNDLIRTLEQSNIRTGVIHCFTGTWGEAQRYIDMGLYLGFNGIIFKMNLDEVIAKAPLDKILLETDCPYLTPPSVFGRNEPIYTKYIAEKIAKVKNLSYEEIIDATTQNARKLFKI
ncbi:MAG: TatD family hydrolase [Candidatus Nealsonbacteria bacterium]|nr:TatD family hydrolase [Candidatus Nealsonbacteria bacterium]